MTTLGDFIREKRVNTLNLSLRAFCLEHGLDAGNWSKIERNMRQVPETATLAEYLKIEKGSGDWHTLVELLAVQEIKERLGDDEVVKRLPIALRAVRQLSDAQLEQLKEELKET